MRDHKLKQPLEVNGERGAAGAHSAFSAPAADACRLHSSSRRYTGDGETEPPTPHAGQSRAGSLEGGFAESPESAVLTQRTDSHAKIPPPAGRLAEGWRPRVPGHVAHRPRPASAPPARVAAPRDCGRRAGAGDAARSAGERAPAGGRAGSEAVARATGLRREDEGRGVRTRREGSGGAGPGSGRGRRQGATGVGAGIKRRCAEGGAGRAVSRRCRGPQPPPPTLGGRRFSPRPRGSEGTSVLTSRPGRATPL